MNSFITGDYKLLGKDIPRLISPSFIDQPKGNVNIEVSNAKIDANVEEIFKKKILKSGKLEINGKKNKSTEDMKNENTSRR